METVYLVPAELKNQKDKFLKAMVSNVDPNDMDMSAVQVGDELMKWDSEILNSKTGEAVAKTGEAVAKSGEAKAILKTDL